LFAPRAYISLRDTHEHFHSIKISLHVPRARLWIVPTDTAFRAYVGGWFDMCWRRNQRFEPLSTLYNALPLHSVYAPVMVVARLTRHAPLLQITLYR